MEFLVTGADGFLGRHCLLWLRRHHPGAACGGVVRRPSPRPLAGVRYLDRLVPARVLFDFAGGGGIAAADTSPEHDLERHGARVIRLLDEARRLGIETTILASSCAVYGVQPSPLREDACPRPASPYGISKLAAEHYALWAVRRHGQDVRVLRIANAYGPGQVGLVVFDLARQAMARAGTLALRSAGTERRDFVHAEDVVAAAVHVADHAGAGAVVNVGSGSPASVIEVARLVARHGGVDPQGVRTPAAPSKSPDLFPSTDRLKALGFLARRDLDDGLRETMAWVKTRTCRG